MERKLDAALLIVKGMTVLEELEKSKGEEVYVSDIEKNTGLKYLKPTVDELRARNFISYNMTGKGVKIGMNPEGKEALKAYKKLEKLLV
jgi:hypothetical protein